MSIGSTASRSLEGDDAWSEAFPSATGWTRDATIHVDHWRATKR